jgi:predicted enzyme related to lactoylglutathione lyase
LLGVDLERDAQALTFEERSDNPQKIEDGMLLHVNVANRLDDALAFIWSNGGRVLDPEPGAAGEDRYALVMDCEGNHLALYTASSEVT